MNCVVYAVTAETSSVLVLQWKIWYFIASTPQVLLVVCSYPSCMCSSTEMTYEVYSEFLLSSSSSHYPDPCEDKAYMALFLKRKSDMCSPQYNYTGISFCDYSGCVNCLTYLIWLCCSDISSAVGSRVANSYHHCSLVLYFFNFWQTEVTVRAFKPAERRQDWFYQSGDKRTTWAQPELRPVQSLHSYLEPMNRRVNCDKQHVHGDTLTESLSSNTGVDTVTLREP